MITEKVQRYRVPAERKGDPSTTRHLEAARRDSIGEEEEMEKDAVYDEAGRVVAGHP